MEFAKVVAFIERMYDDVRETIEHSAPAHEVVYNEVRGNWDAAIAFLRDALAGEADPDEALLTALQLVNEVNSLARDRGVRDKVPRDVHWAVEHARWEAVWWDERGGMHVSPDYYENEDDAVAQIADWATQGLPIRMAAIRPWIQAYDCLGLDPDRTCSACLGHYVDVTLDPETGKPEAAYITLL